MTNIKDLIGYRIDNVVQCDIPGDSCYQATIGDYDLDCKTGLGYTPDEAKDELMAQLGF